jgi:hypothetical protein
LEVNICVALRIKCVTILKEIPCFAALDKSYPSDDYQLIINSHFIVISTKYEEKSLTYEKDSTVVTPLDDKRFVALVEGVGKLREIHSTCPCSIV